MHLNLGEEIWRRSWRVKRLGARGFAKIQISLLLELPYEVLFRCLGCYSSRFISLEYLERLPSGSLSLEVGSEVATSDLEWRRSRVH